MNSISSIALSGLGAAQTSLNVSAHNIANVPTEGFHRQQVQYTEQTGGGVQTQVTQTTTQGSSLETDVVQQLQAKNAFLANLAVFKTSDKMAGAMMDTLA